MKIVSWNCNKNFREKYKEISKLDADIYIISECEDPSMYDGFSPNYIWIGDDYGLGIFAKDHIKLEALPHNNPHNHFLPVRINDQFKILGVWTVPANPEVPEEFLSYCNQNESLFDENLIVCCDFKCEVNLGFSVHEGFHQIIDIFKSHNLIDIYRHFNKYEKPDMAWPTYYKDGRVGYHLDHVFARYDSIETFNVLEKEEWIEFSDHMPLIFDVADDVFSKSIEEREMERNLTRPLALLNMENLKICNLCSYVSTTEDECPICGGKLITPKKLGQSIEYLYYKRQTTRTLYRDPSYAIEANDEFSYYAIRNYMLLVAFGEYIDDYLFGILKVYYSYEPSKREYEILDLKDMLDICSYLLEIDPDNRQYLHYKARFLKKMGRYEEALECYDILLEKDKYNGLYAYERSRIF